MVVYSLPPKSARLISFTGSVSAILDGDRFVFSKDKFKLCDTVGGFVYLINQLSFSPSMEVAGYCRGVDPDNMPMLQIVDRNGNSQNSEGVGLVLPLQNFPIETWYSSDSGGMLRASLSGVVMLTEQTITDTLLRMNFAMSGYEIPANTISAAFRDQIADSSPVVFRGGVR